MIVSIDLGSNSLRVLQMKCDDFTTINEYEKTVGTADGLKATGSISNEAINRIIKALQEAKEKINFDSTKAVAVTTQAMRIASNNQEVLAQIENETGIRFSIIDGEREANLTLLAIRYALKRHNIDDGKFVALDIGGGSTELIVVDDGIKVKSFPYGIVTLAQSSDRDNELNILKNLVQEYLLKNNLQDYIFVSTAGTPTTIAAMMHNMTYLTYDKHKVNGTKVSLEDVFQVQKYLLSLSESELEIKVGTGRTAYINTGIEIFKLFYDVLEKDESIVFDDGLREGIAIDACLRRLHRL